MISTRACRLRSRARAVDKPPAIPSSLIDTFSTSISPIRQKAVPLKIVNISGRKASHLNNWSIICKMSACIFKFHALLAVPFQEPSCLLNMSTSVRMNKSNASFARPIVWERMNMSAFKSCNPSFNKKNKRIWYFKDNYKILKKISKRSTSLRLPVWSTSFKNKK